jgi:hypothetical protein
MQAPGLVFILQWISLKLQSNCLRILSKPVDEAITIDRISASISPKNDEIQAKLTSIPSSAGDYSARSGSHFSNKKAISQEKAQQMKKFLNKRSTEESRANTTHSKVSPSTNRKPRFGLNRYAFDYTGRQYRHSKVSGQSLQRSQVGQTMFELTVRRVALALMVRIIFGNILPYTIFVPTLNVSRTSYFIIL